MFENEREEEYMGMISWSRIQCGTARNLFGTEITTSHPIRLEISNAAESRELSKNWHFARNKIIEVEMSPIQWAEFLTSGNTSGVPCTLKWIRGKGQLPEPEASTLKEDYNKEVNEVFERFGKSFDELHETVSKATEGGKPLGKKAVEELLHRIEVLKSIVTSNVDFVKDSFKEDLDGIVVKAKAEFNAYVEDRIHEIGIEALKDGSVKFLEDKEN